MPCFIYAEGPFLHGFGFIDVVVCVVYFPFFCCFRSILCCRVSFRPMGGAPSGLRCPPIPPPSPSHILSFLLGETSSQWLFGLTRFPASKQTHLAATQGT